MERTKKSCWKTLWITGENILFLVILAWKQNPKWRLNLDIAFSTCINILLIIIIIRKIFGLFSYLLLDWSIWILLSTGTQKLEETGKKITWSTSKHRIKPCILKWRQVTTSANDVTIKLFLNTLLTLNAIFEITKLSNMPISIVIFPRHSVAFSVIRHTSKYNPWLKYLKS